MLLWVDGGGGGAYSVTFLRFLVNSGFASALVVVME